MTIKQIDCFSRTFQLRNPYTIAYDAIATAPNLFVRIETSSGLIGWGNAAPDAYVTGETLAMAEAKITNVLIPALLGQEVLALSALHEILQAQAPHTPAACAALEIALYDLAGKILHLPLYKFFGWARSQILTSITIGITNLDESVRQAREFIQAGFCVLKIKTGNDWQEDVARIKAIRAAAGAAIVLRIDANQGYSVEQAIKFSHAIENCQIEFIEQPTPAKNFAALQAVRESSKIPIMADESALSNHDVLTLAANGAADMVNLKLMKNGGITNTIQAAAIAGAGKMPVMLGCNDESKISIAAAVHLACGLNGIRYADLDGAFDIVDDLAAGGFELREGYLLPSNLPGLGVQVKI